MKKQFFYTTILCFYIFFSVNFLKAQDKKDQDENWWKLIYNSGINCLENGKTDEAVKLFQSIADKNDEIAEAYVGLGLTADKKEPGCREAQSLIEKALRIDRDNAQAHYALGTVYSHQKYNLLKAKDELLLAVQTDASLYKAWLELEKIEETLNSPYPDIVKYYSKVLESKNQDPMIYARFVEAVFWFDGEDLGIETLQNLIKKYPANVDYLYDLARFYYSKGEYKTSVQLLDSLKKISPEFSQFKRNYLLAKDQFGLNQTEKGSKYYTYALSVIKDSSDLKMIFDDVCYIMNDDEYEALQKISLENAPEFYLRFWSRKDVNHATDLNERIPEHYGRLIFAKKNFRRYNTTETHAEFLHKTMHPLISTVGNIKTGDDFLRPYSKALAGKYYYDDMGIILIRHGNPNKTAYLNVDPKYGDYPPDGDLQDNSNMSKQIPLNYINPNAAGGSSARTPNARIVVDDATNKIPTADLSAPSMNMSWVYYAQGDRPELVFHFVNFAGKRGWQIESMPWYLSERQYISPTYMTLKKGIREGNSGDIVSTGEILKEINVKSTDVGLKTETSNYVDNTGGLEFPFAFLTFKGINGKEIVELYYGLDGKKIEIDTLKKPNAIPLSKFIGLYDTKMNEIGRIKEDIRVPVSTTPAEWKNQSAVMVERFEAPSGKFNYEFQLKNNKPENRGLYKGMLNVKDYQQKEIAMSDIIVCGQIEESDKVTPFRKGKIVYSPHFFTSFRKSETVGLYYEAYNLSKGNSNLTDFEQKVSISEYEEPKSGLSKAVNSVLNTVGIGKKDGIILASNYQTQETDPQMYFQLDMSKYAAGKYVIEITVKDKLSAHEASSQTLINWNN